MALQQIAHRIATLIRQQPSISARRVAVALGYAEPKSIYYWLGKEGFTFNGFKDAVLSGAFDAAFATLSQPRAVYSGGAQVADTFAADGLPVLSGQAAPFVWLGGARLLYRLPLTAAGSGSVAPGDWLVIGEDVGQVARGLLLWANGQPIVARQLMLADRLLLMNEATGDLIEPPFPPVIGPLLASVRILTDARAPTPKHG